MTNETWPWDEKQNYQTGDILLFSGSGIISDVIEIFTESKYSHVAMVVTGADAKKYLDPELDENTLYMWESGAASIPDSVEHKKIIGVQIIPMSNGIGTYKGGVDWRSCKTERNEAFYKGLQEAFKVCYGKKYDLDPFDWLKALLGIEIGDEQKTNEFWCSALLAYLYVQLDLLPEDLKWTIIKPEQFSSTNHSGVLPFQNCELADDFQIKEQYVHKKGMHVKYDIIEAEQKITEGIKDGVKDVEKKVEEGVEKVGEAIGNVAEEVVKDAIEVEQKVEDGVHKVEEKVAEETKEVAKEVKEVEETVVDDVKEVAKDAKKVEEAVVHDVKETGKEVKHDVKAVEKEVKKDVKAAEKEVKKDVEAVEKTCCVVS